MSCWLTDPDLFLYAKGSTGSDDVHLWRCKKPAASSSSTSSSSSLVVPIKPDDFDFVKIVENHLELIADLFDWDETDYKRLVKYIFERRLLVNSQGFVIAELLHNEEDVPAAAIYIRSLDVLALKLYIPKLRERPSPLRTVRILEDVNGKAAVMEEDSKVTKLTARVDNLEGKVTKLTAELATTKGGVADLQSKNKTLEAENKTLDSNVKTLEGKVTKLTADLDTTVNTLANLQRELKENPNYNEVWMNYLTHTTWVGIERLKVWPRDKITIIGQKGTFTTDDNGTNVRARYIYTLRINDYPKEYIAVSLEDLTPNKEKARFAELWHCNIFQGKTYICRLRPADQAS